MYSGAEKCMLYCVVSKKEIVQVKEIVREVDPDAFVIVSDAREVLGEGEGGEAGGRGGVGVLGDASGAVAGIDAMAMGVYEFHTLPLPV